MEIITNAENRKELVKTLSGHFGQKSEYLGPPSFAYRIGSITVDRDAKVILEDDSMEDEVRRVLFQNDVAEEIQETQTEEPEAEIKIPIGSMTPQGIINLINMMHSKQYLINRAVGRECISIADSLINALAESNFEDTESTAGFITEQGGCSGVTFADGNIEFTGFPHTDVMMEYCRLASAMVKKASEQKKAEWDASMPVEELMQKMSLEDAKNYLIPIGAYKGKTLGELCVEKPGAINWYVESYHGKNNVLRAGAKLLLAAVEK